MTAPDPSPIPAEVSAVEVLRKFEWTSVNHEFGPFCIVCGARQQFGSHTTDCRLAAALGAQPPMTAAQAYADAERIAREWAYQMERPVQEVCAMVADAIAERARAALGQDAGREERGDAAHS